MESGDIVALFATPLILPETDYDRRALADAASLEFPFEGQSLSGYTWGSGPVVLLAHGWNSRASHLAPLARTLAKAGFRVVAYDQPAHGRSLKNGRPNRSSMPEFARAAAAVAGILGPLHALVGHSLGAAASALAAGGSVVVPGGKVATERLVLISSPAGTTSILDSFCRNNHVEDRRDELVRGIETGYGLPIQAYAVDPSLRSYAGRVLIIHDQEDAEVPIADARILAAACPSAQLLVTHGAGHGEILGNRTMFKAVRDFLVKP
jgi:pimeloyl-ACP methyl ester carboxylesterase